MKQTNISIFIPHIGCPHRCSFCDQKSISGENSAPTADEVTALLDEQAVHLAERGMRAEIAFFGGSFTAIPREYMLELLESARQAVQRYEVYCGIRCSTRPDCISEEIVALLKEYGMTAIELGAQSMSDEVLTANRRGHSAEDVRRAAEIIKRSGISLGLQMMTGLYRDTSEAVRETAREFIGMAPDTVRIYPTVILKNTHLGRLYESGEYHSFSFEDTVELCADLLQEFEQAGIAVIRMGLHASPDVEREMLGGTYHPAFRELCESRIIYKDMLKRLEQLPKGGYTVYTDARNISKAVGQRRANVESLAELGYKIKVVARQGEYILVEPNG